MSDNILIHRLGSLGDTLVALPAFHWIRLNFPTEKITLLTNLPINGKASPASAVLESMNLVDEYLSYPIATRSAATLLRLRGELSRRRFRTVFALSQAKGWAKSVRDQLFFRACGIRNIVGCALRRKDLVCRAPSGQNQYDSEATRLIRRVRAEGCIDLQEDRWWDLRLTELERTRAADLLAEQRIAGGFIAFSLGTKVEVNDWTTPNWCRLMQQLGRVYPQLPLIGFGVAEERGKTEQVLRFWPGTSANFCGQLSPRTSAAVFERAELFLGHDSGPMHLAATVGIKCVAIFSARHPPGQWFPRGQGHQVLYNKTPCFGCGLSTCPDQAKKCILGISVEEVAAAVAQVLRSRSDLGREGLKIANRGGDASSLVDCDNALALQGTSRPRPDLNWSILGCPPTIS